MNVAEALERLEGATVESATVAEDGSIVIETSFRGTDDGQTQLAVSWYGVRVRVRDDGGDWKPL